MLVRMKYRNALLDETVVRIIRERAAGITDHPDLQGHNRAGDIQQEAFSKETPHPVTLHYSSVRCQDNYEAHEDNLFLV